MLKLSTPINSIRPTLMSSFEPGIQFALDLTDSIPEVPGNGDVLQPKTRGVATYQRLAEAPVYLRPLATSTTPLSSFSDASLSLISPSGHQESLRPRILAVEQHTASRGAPQSLHMEPLRPLPMPGLASSFATGSSSPGQHLDSSSRQHLPDEAGINAPRRQSQESYAYQSESPVSHTYTDFDLEINSRRSPEIGRNSARYNTRRRPFNQDEFDGPNQLLPLPVPPQELSRSQDLPSLPVHLSIQEQGEILQRANYILSQCAYHFVAKYQFPIPLERDKPRVCSPADREWTEWAYLLKRLATKRRIPARVLFENQIKQFVTTLENSIAARPSRDQQNRSPKDDRYILQLVSAGTQVAKIVMDSEAMDQLDQLYRNTEAIILERRAREMTVGYR